jgi:hypothetical protein
MNKQPRALRLADAIDKAIRPEASLPLGDWARSAAELRRLHSLNQELVEALSVCVYHGEGLSENHQSYLPPSVRYKAKSALAKARRTE